MDQHHISGAALVVAAADLRVPALVLTAMPGSTGPLAIPINGRRRRRGRVLLSVEGGGELSVVPGQPLLVIKADQVTAAVYGYARVSTGQQNLDAQLDVLRLAGVERVFTDKLSGVRADRPGLLACLDRLRPGDTLVVVALDRLGRSVLQVVGTLTELHDRGVVVRSLRENLDLSTPTGKVVAAMFAALAELERELIRERAAAARDAARARGRQVGRPPVLTLEQAALARRMRRAGEPIAVIARAVDCSRATVYRVTAEEAHI